MVELLRNAQDKRARKLAKKRVRLLLFSSFCVFAGFDWASRWFGGEFEYMRLDEAGGGDMEAETGTYLGPVISTCRRAHSFQRKTRRGGSFLISPPKDDELFRDTQTASKFNPTDAPTHSLFFISRFVSTNNI